MSRLRFKLQEGSVSSSPGGPSFLVSFDSAKSSPLLLPARTSLSPLTPAPPPEMERALSALSAPSFFFFANLPELERVPAVATAATTRRRGVKRAPERRSSSSSHDEYRPEKQEKMNKKKKKKNTTKTTFESHDDRKQVLVDWYVQNNGLEISPSAQEKAQLAALSGMTEKQV
jgi:hypothetical protein